MRLTSIKKTAPLLMSLFLFGCQDFSGQMNVRTPFEAISKNGLFSKAHEITVPAGTHSIQIDATSEGASVQLRLNGKKETIRLMIPKNRLPKDNGSFDVQSDELGQPFDIHGDLRTNRQRSGDYREIEGCTRTISREVCSWDPVSGTYRCHTDTITISGQRQVEYHYVTTMTSLAVAILNSQEPGAVMATLDGARSENAKIYTYQGICY